VPDSGVERPPDPQGGYEVLDDGDDPPKTAAMTSSARRTLSLRSSDEFDGSSAIS
jgi:hypothetical protein